MARFKIGDVVVLVGTDGYMPPLGSTGEVLSGIDSFGDYEVYFPVYPCPVPPETSWYIQEQFLKPFAPLSVDELETSDAI
jgi:hypothetical protein